MATAAMTMRPTTTPSAIRALPQPGMPFFRGAAQPGAPGYGGAWPGTANWPGRACVPAGAPNWACWGTGTDPGPCGAPPKPPNRSPGAAAPGPDGAEGAAGGWPGGPLAKKSSPP